MNVTVVIMYGARACPKIPIICTNAIPWAITGVGIISAANCNNKFDAIFKTNLALMAIATLNVSAKKKNLYVTFLIIVFLYYGTVP